MTQGNRWYFYLHFAHSSNQQLPFVRIYRECSIFVHIKLASRKVIHFSSNCDKGQTLS